MDHSTYRNRRTFLKQTALLGAGCCLLPACDERPNENRKTEILQHLIACILPIPHVPDLIGELQDSVSTMLQHCRPKAVYQSTMRDMETLTRYARAKIGIPFVRLDPGRQLTVVRSVLDNPKSDPGLRDSVADIRRLVIQAYTHSQYYLTHVEAYQLIPGHFSGCTPIT